MSKRTKNTKGKLANSKNAQFLREQARARFNKENKI
jgi:hypothetical protein